MSIRYNRPKAAAAMLACIALVAAVTAPAQAQSAAEKTLGSDKFTLVAPFPPGGPIDMLARVLAAGLTKRYGQTAVVDNAPGAAGNIGMEKVKRAKPDGHALLVIPAGNLTINPTLMPKFPFSIERDFVPVSMLASAPNVLVVNPATGFKSVQDLIKAARSKPDTLSYASPGIGSGLHLAGELFKSQAGIDVLHVAYKGTTPALNDVLGGIVPMMFSNLPAVLPHIRSGKLAALGVTDTKRAQAAPDIPTLAEQGVAGVVVTSWYGLLAPAGTPAGVAAQLARDAQDILSQPEVRERLETQGLSQWKLGTDAFAAHIRTETANWAKVINDRGIKME